MFLVFDRWTNISTFCMLVVRGLPILSTTKMSGLLNPKKYKTKSLWIHCLLVHFHLLDDSNVLIVYNQLFRFCVRCWIGDLHVMRILSAGVITFIQRRDRKGFHHTILIFNLQEYYYALFYLPHILRYKNSEYYYALFYLPHILRYKNSFFFLSV